MKSATTATGAFEGEGWCRAGLRVRGAMAVVIAMVAAGVATPSHAQNAMIAANIVYRSVFDQSTPGAVSGASARNQFSGVGLLDEEGPEPLIAEVRPPSGPFAGGVSLFSDDGRAYVVGTVTVGTRSGLMSVFGAGSYQYFIEYEDGPLIQTSIQQSFAAGLWPSAPPSLSGAQWSVLGEVDVGDPITVSIPSFVRHPQADQARIFIFVQENLGTELGSLEFSATLPNTASSVTIPADSLRGDVEYVFTVVHQNIKQDASQPTTLKEVHFENRTQIPMLTVQAGACLADVSGAGGGEGADGVLDNNDFIVFIQRFFDMSSKADIGVQGGAAGRDGVFDNNDFIVFIQRFFAGC